MQTTLRFSLLLSLLIGFVSTTLAQPCYTYRTFDIPTPTGVRGQTSFEAINHSGTILGQYANQEPPDGYRLRRKVGTKITVTPYPGMPGHASWPRALNLRDDTVGQRVPLGGGKFTGYVRLRTGGIQVVDVPGSTQTEALGINRQRDVVGYYYTPDGISHGFWRYKMQYVTIDAPDPTAEGTQLTGINETKEIVGWYWDASGLVHGLHIVGGLPVTLDVPGADNTFLLDVNDAGAIVGLHTPAEAPGQGFLYQDGTFYAITPNVGELHSEATGISNTGEIVGNYLDAVGLIHGFVATPQLTCTTAPALVALAMP